MIPPMSHAARSVLVFGIYLVAVGLALVVIPSPLLVLLQFPASHEVWPRVVGVLALVLAYYYVQAARHELTAFFRWTVTARVAVFVIFTALVLLRLAPAPLALLGGVDLLAAAWTGWALRASGHR
jgi:hypothetical protein